MQAASLPRLRRSSNLLLAIVAGCFAGETQAGWHHRYGCGSCGGHHHRGWHHGSHGSSHGSWGGSHGGSSGGGTAPAAAPKAPSKTANLVPADGALLLVDLPADAKLFINGNATGLTGGLRRFSAAGLASEQRYEYDVRMVIGDGPLAREQSKRVWLSAGEEQTVVFDAAEGGTLVASSSASPAAEMTNLTLRVPAEAQVWIEGRLTSSGGTVRTFGTRQLAAGEEWKDYEVRVVTVIDGQERSLVRTLTLTGGANVDLTIDPALQSPAMEATASLR